MSDQYFDELSETYFNEWDTFAEHQKVIQRVTEHLTKHFIDIPLVALIYMDRTMKMYGPFQDGVEASEWCKNYLPRGVHLVWQPLRNPYIVRRTHEFYLPERMENLDKEYDHTIKETANDISTTS